MMKDSTKNNTETATTAELLRFGEDCLQVSILEKWDTTTAVVLEGHFIEKGNKSSPAVTLQTVPSTRRYLGKCYCLF